MNIFAIGWVQDWWFSLSTCRAISRITWFQRILQEIFIFPALCRLLYFIIYCVASIPESDSDEAIPKGNPRKRTIRIYGREGRKY